MLTQDELLARRVDDVEALGFVETAVRRRTPFSFVRLNDGEAYIVGAGHGVPDADVAWILHHWWGWTETDFAFVAWLRERLLDVAASADLLGFFDPVDMKAARFGRMGMLLREYADLSAVRAFVTPEAALKWHDANLIGRFLYRQPKVKVICAYDISAKLSSKFRLASVEWIPIPGHAKYSDQAQWGYSHPLRRFDEVDAYLKQISEKAIVLVGAGALGKIYCHTIKQHGGIAIDIGSVFDSWGENMRRLSARSRRKGV